MHEENVFWVLSRLKIEIIKFPRWRDCITIQTWSNGLSGLFAIRNFQVLSETGEVLINAISSWLMVNTQSRRLVRADDFMHDFPVLYEQLFDQNPDKIEQLNSALGFIASNVEYNEIDMNYHVNNVSYIDRIINSF